jgi:hypothetical protein
MNSVPQPPVPLEDAVDMTTNWRDYYGQITGTDPNDALRAFRIPMEDLRAMMLMADMDPTITSVRGYLALGEPAGNNIIDPNIVHILMVPVSDITPTGTDILETTIMGRKTSTIMDFTSPCPAACDFNSPLYGPILEQ